MMAKRTTLVRVEIGASNASSRFPKAHRKAHRTQARAGPGAFRNLSIERAGASR